MTETANAKPPNTLPAPAQPPPEKGAERQRQRMDAILHAVDTKSAMLRTLLEGTGITLERFTEVIRRALIRNPDLIECDGGSMLEACINGATDGLLPDGRQGAIVVYNVNVANRRRKEPDRWVKKANWQPMYQGLLDIAYASGNFKSIEARVVYEGDLFEYELGDDAFIKHRPRSRPAGAAQPAIAGAYAVAKTVNGGVFREVFEGADIAKVNAVSKATNGPGVKWPEEMARKGPLRRMWKFLPKNEAMNRIVERDNEAFDLEADLEPEAPARERRLVAGFAKPAAPAQIEQGADLTMDLGGQPEGELVENDFPGDRASNQAAKSNMPPEEDRSTPAGDGDSSGLAEESEEQRPPEVASFETQLAAAANWASVKHALKTFDQGELGANELFGQIARTRAWGRMVELRQAGKDKTDFATDPLLFECWLLGAEPIPPPEAVAGNWEIVQQEKGWAKLSDADRERITGRVTEALEPPAEEGESQ